MHPAHPAHRKFWHGSLGLILVLAAGIAISINFYRVVRENELSRLEADFNRRASGRQALIQEGLRGYEECIYNLRSLFANSDDVNPEEFLAAARDIRTRRPDIEAIEWVPVVRNSERAAVERFWRERHSPGFNITSLDADGRLAPAAVRDVYYPILYIHPLEENRSALGYDLGVSPIRHNLAAAIKRGSLTMTGKIHPMLSGPDSREYSLIMMCPVYHLNAKGKDTCIGLVQILFRLEDMVGQSWRNYSSSVMDTFIEDISAADPSDRFLFSRASDYLPGRPPLRAQSDLAAEPRQEFIWNVGGRTWRSTYAVPPGWMDRQVSYTPLFMLFGGLTFTGLLGAYYRKALRQTEIVTREVHERTAELLHTQQLLETDIAQRQATEAELRESRRQLESLMGKLPCMVYRCTRKNRYAPVFVSQGSLDIIGLTPHELLSSETLRFSRLILDEDRLRCREAFYAAMGQRHPYEMEYRVRHKDGALKWVLDRGQGVYDGEGALLFIEGLLVDITARKDAENEKLALERKLLESQKLESLGVLAGGIAHDFNNLLTGILGNANLVSLDLPRGSPLQKNLKQIESASLRAAELCQQMLAYAGKGRFLIQRVNLEEIIRNTVPLLEHSISKRARMRFNFHPGLPCVSADVTQIRQIIMNLVVNASDAIGEHDGLITLGTGRMSADDPRLRQAVLAPAPSAAGLVFLQVQDTGAGMDAETIAKIFEPFFTTKFTGRGLGLAAVLGIVRSHKGGLTVASRPGQGTTFTLLLPAAEAPAELKLSRSPFSDSVMRTGTALIIDDEQPVIEVTSHMFAMFGMKTLTARDGVEGLEVFRRHQADITLILLDLTMPRMNGEQTLREIRALSPSVPVILTSGYNRTTLTSPLASSSTVTFLQKPFTITGLVEQIEAVTG